MISAAAAMARWPRGDFFGGRVSRCGRSRSGAPRSLHSERRGARALAHYARRRQKNLAWRSAARPRELRAQASTPRLRRRCRTARCRWSIPLSAAARTGPGHLRSSRLAAPRRSSGQRGRHPGSSLGRADAEFRGRLMRGRIDASSPPASSPPASSPPASSPPASLPHHRRLQGHRTRASSPRHHRRGRHHRRRHRFWLHHRCSAIGVVKLASGNKWRSLEAPHDLGVEQAG